MMTLQTDITELELVKNSTNTIIEPEQLSTLLWSTGENYSLDLSWLLSFKTHQSISYSIPMMDERDNYS